MKDIKTYIGPNVGSVTVLVATGVGVLFLGVEELIIREVYGVEPGYSETVFLTF